MVHFSPRLWTDIGIRKCAYRHKSANRQIVICGDAPTGNASLRPGGNLSILWARPVLFCGGGLFYICGDAQSLPCVRGGGKNLLIFAGGVVNPPVSCADSPLYTRGPLDRQIPTCRFADLSRYAHYNLSRGEKQQGFPGSGAVFWKK